MQPTLMCKPIRRRMHTGFADAYSVESETMYLQLRAVCNVCCWGVMSLHFASYFAESHSWP
jgi:hypothetical protein